MARIYGVITANKLLLNVLPVIVPVLLLIIRSSPMLKSPLWLVPVQYTFPWFVVTAWLAASATPPKAGNAVLTLVPEPTHSKV